MTVTVRVGAVHLGWDVVSVAAGGGRTPIRPVQVEGTYTPPAYLLADASGRLHTAGVDRQRPDLGMAIADVRDILGHPQIVVAGATWPAEMVFRARMYNPLAAIGKYLRGKPDVVALPFPDGWPDEKVDIYAELVETLDVVVEPLPESVALSGYVRALGLVRAPDERNPRGVGATGVYSDGRTMLVVAVHGDDEQPTESVDVPVTSDAMRDARSADNVVIEVMAAARSIGADTSTVLLSGNVCFNEALRFAFQNHLGHRLQVADHPMHALVLGATHLLVTDSAAGEPEQGGRHAEPRSEYPPQAQHPGQWQAEAGQRPVEPPVPPAQRPVESAHRPPETAQRPPETVQRPDLGPQAPSGSPVVTYGPGYPTVPPNAEPAPSEEPTTRVTREDLARGLPPNLAELGSRFTRPPGQHGDDQRNPALGHQAPSSPPPGPRSPYPPPNQQGSWQAPSESEEDDEDGKGRKGKIWGKMKGNLFGAHTIAGAVALAVVAMPAEGDRIELTGAAEPIRSVVGEVAPVACGLTPHVAPGERRQGIAAVREPAAVDSECAPPSMDTLRYVVPGPPGAIDPGAPVEI
ncbi:hypothetical protein [Nocardia amikacinitolerans]|uniref:hypothetical protein n=1 Tax=Nocardia amikacinitolerans TaxID=756689 RepID=UPI0020A2A50F|nr:hypothetical protein [Nocardia amikacinitolerans]